MSVTFRREFDVSDDLDAGIGSDLTYVRTGTAYHYFGGTLQARGANIPRLQSTVHLNGADISRGLLIDGALDNLMPEGDFDHADWSVIRLSKVDTETRRGLRGTEVNDTVTADNSHLILDNIVLTNGVQYCFSWHARVEPGASIPFVYFRSDALVANERAYFDIANGATGTIPASFDDAGVETIGDGIYRCWITFTVNAVTGSRAMQIFQALANDDNSFAGDGTRTCWLYEAQLEIGPAPSSWIDGVDSRGAGACTGALVPEAITVIYIEGETNTRAGVLLQIDDGTEDERIRIERTAAGGIVLTVTDGGVEQAAPTAGIIGDHTFFRLACRIATNDISVSLDGATSVLDGLATLPTMTTIRVGHDTAAGEEWNGMIGKIEIRNDTRTDAELELLSANGIVGPGNAGGLDLGSLIAGIMTEEDFDIFTGV